MPFSEARSEVAEWNELVEKYNFVAGKMATRGYPIKLASTAVRRSAKQHRQNQQPDFSQEAMSRYEAAFSGLGQMNRELQGLRD